jgi:hypothetical protein
MAPGETHLEKYIEVDLPLPSDSGIISVALTKVLSHRVKELLARKKPNFLPLFSYTSCVQNIALFEDHFKIAVAAYMGNESCIVGVRIDAEVEWHFEKSSIQLRASKELYENYLNEGEVKMYELPSTSSHTLALMVESDLVDELGNMDMTVTFFSTRGE